MCGILASVRHPLDESAMLDAVSSLDHRGPDGRGAYVDSANRVGLAHTRLAIIDPDGGAQPVFSENRDIVLVANGEIYDFERIRAGLQALGHRFATGSDSEVIVHLYEQHGPSFTDHLRGEFAFVLYDREARRVIAVRDRFGIKPLYFHEAGGKYLFASEAKAIFATGLHAPRIDPVAVRDYMSGIFPDSIFEGVSVVPPGCAVEIDLAGDSHTVRRYWTLDLSVGAPSLNGGQDTARVRDAFDEAVRLRLRSDVPVGVYLSGGIDSAIVAGTAARYHAGPMKAFNIRFPDDEAFDEHDLAREMAAAIGAEFHAVTCSRQVLVENTEDALWASEYPFFNFHGVGKFCLSRLASAHVKVVLTWEGADEVFLGYPHFQPGAGAMMDQMSGDPRSARRRGNRWRDAPGEPRHVRELRSKLGFVPIREHAVTTSPWARRLFRALIHTRPVRHLAARTVMNALAMRVDRARTDRLPVVRRIQHFGFGAILSPYILGTLGDRAEMAHGIEGRTPFLDHELFEVARSVPDDHKIRNGVEKAILREAFRDRMTASIAGRKKWPYAAPPLWIRRGESPELDRLVQRHLSRKAIRRGGIFNSWAVALVRMVLRVLPARSGLKRRLNVLLVFCLTVQILDRLYGQEFRYNLEKRRRR
jgi:asparagine synthase (glutamine-hydrolysing)